MRFKLPSSESLKNVVEIIALIAAGIWFFTRGEATNRLNITADIQSLKLTEDIAWLRCDAELDNVGSRKIQIQKTTARLQQMLPLDPYIQNRLKSENRLLKPGSRVADWPLLDKIERNEEVTISPGEKQMLSWEFQVPRHVKVVRIYLYLVDSKKAIAGWTLSRVHTVNWQEIKNEP